MCHDYVTVKVELPSRRRRCATLRLDNSPPGELRQSAHWPQAGSNWTSEEAGVTQTSAGWECVFGDSLISLGTCTVNPHHAAAVEEEVARLLR